MDLRILIAAANPVVRLRVAESLSASPLDVTTDDPGDVLDRLVHRRSLRLLILAESHGNRRAALDLVSAARERRPDLAVLLLSEHPTSEHAAEAIRCGAEDLVAIPYCEEVLRKQVARVLEAADLRDRLHALRRLVPRHDGLRPIISRAACMQPVFDRAEAAARNDTPVLITGETGTGKELVARAIHANSRRAQKPFVPINCAALPRDLLESELFGHKRGAFSGAHADYAGLFVAAHGGTLFLDEIGELPVEAQPKLLRVLQDGEIRPVGGLDSRTVDVRIIAATNRPLEAISHGGMRQDLFFRLSVVVIEIPPLRARLDDLPLLVQAFIAQLRDRGLDVESMDADALPLLTAYAFPGNVRELENLIEGAAVMLGDGRRAITADAVRTWLRRRGGPARAAETAEMTDSLPPLRLDHLTAWAVAEALRRTRGNKRQAAHLLGISRDTLYRKLEDLSLDSDMSDSRTVTASR